MEASSAWIAAHYRVIVAVSKHVIAKQTLSVTCVSIRIQESTQIGIVVTGLEIIELGISIVALATDSQNSLFVLENNSSPEGELLPLRDFISRHG